MAFNRACSFDLCYNIQRLTMYVCGTHCGQLLVRDVTSRLLASHVLFILIPNKNAGVSLCSVWTRNCYIIEHWARKHAHACLYVLKTNKKNLRFINWHIFSLLNNVWIVPMLSISSAPLKKWEIPWTCEHSRTRSTECPLYTWIICLNNQQKCLSWLNGIEINFQRSNWN